jgi:hypothetical protein
MKVDDVAVQSLLFFLLLGPFDLADDLSPVREGVF